MTATDRQVYIAMKERRKGKTQEQAAAKANLKSRQTAAKYEKLGQLPSQQRQPRPYRTRQDPFAEDWPAVVAMHSIEQAVKLAHTQAHLMDGIQIGLYDPQRCAQGLA